MIERDEKVAETYFLFYYIFVNSARFIPSLSVFVSFTASCGLFVNRFQRGVEMKLNKKNLHS